LVRGLTMSLEKVRISKQGRDQLITLKRRTGIENWNILCRWAFCLSLSDPTPPRKHAITLEGGVEMTWRTFGGEYEDIYLVLLKERCKQDGYEIDEETLTQQFRFHIHRGISHLVGTSDMRSVDNLIKLVS